MSGQNPPWLLLLSPSFHRTAGSGEQAWLGSSMPSAVPMVPPSTPHPFHSSPAGPKPRLAPSRPQAFACPTQMPLRFILKKIDSGPCLAGTGRTVRGAGDRTQEWPPLSTSEHQMAVSLRVATWAASELGSGLGPLTRRWTCWRPIAGSLRPPPWLSAAPVSGWPPPLLPVRPAKRTHGVQQSPAWATGLRPHPLSPLHPTALQGFLSLGGCAQREAPACEMPKTHQWEVDKGVRRSSPHRPRWAEPGVCARPSTLMPTSSLWLDWRPWIVWGICRSPHLPPARASRWTVGNMLVLSSGV